MTKIRQLFAGSKRAEKHASRRCVRSGPVASEGTARSRPSRYAEQSAGVDRDPGKTKVTAPIRPTVAFINVGHTYAHLFMA
jgi:hypothetical protein